MEDQPGREARASFPRLVLTLVIVELTLVTAYLHLTLGGQLFTLNGLGYLAFAAAYAVAVLTPFPLIQRFAWLPRIGLAVYTLVTVGAYLVAGPYYSTGWIAKGVEVAIVALLVADIVAAYRTPRGLWRAAIGSLPFIGRGQGPRHA
jgi:hypothetical protein